MWQREIKVGKLGEAAPKQEEVVSDAEEAAWVEPSPVQGLWVNAFALLAGQQPLIKLGFLAISRGAQNAGHPC
jgi:hypothetical protein